MNIGDNDKLSDNEEEGAGLCVPPIIPNPSRTRKLILHLDLNNTIIVCDSATGQGPRGALNSYLSTVTWGRVSPSGDWQWIGDQPSLRPPTPDAINYYTQFGRDPHFTDSRIGGRFQETLSRHLEALRWRGAEDAMFTQRGEDGQLYHWILPSFFHLLLALHLQRRSFSIILRTFGSDLPRVLQSVRSALTANHPQFPQLRNLPLGVEVTPGRIRCSKQGTVVSRGEERVSTKGRERNVYDYFTSLAGVTGFQDHFDWWARNSFTSAGGKPFWIDPNDGDNLHLIIDDNIRLTRHDSDTIVNSRVLLQGKGKSRKAVTAELYGVCLVQTDLLQAITDEEYFLRCVQTCEDNYERYLRNDLGSAHLPGHVMDAGCDNMDAEGPIAGF